MIQVGRRSRWAARHEDLRAACRAPVVSVSYGDSEALAADLLEQGSNGLLYRSVRHAGGECIACFRPALVLNVRASHHYEYRWKGGATAVMRKL